LIVDLSILIPARSEMFLQRTIEDALQHSRANTEIIAVLDGEWATPAIPRHPHVNVFHTGVTVGMRAATNCAARLASGRYLMKVDAHCAFDEGFDQKMLEFHDRVGNEVTSAPIMRNLWAFDWKCHHCGFRQYKGPTPGECKHCGCSNRWQRKMIWKGKSNPQSWAYCFDAEPHFQYHEE
jgi:glycosyltransferase involved in cell wall biosynthesis